jgi:hypothetical protein
VSDDEPASRSWHKGRTPSGIRSVCLEVLVFIRLGHDFGMGVLSLSFL